MQKLSLQEDDGLGWFSQIRERLTGDDLIEAVIIARLLWLRRNACVFRGEVFTPTQTVKVAQVMLLDFKLANMREPWASTTEELY